MNRAILAFLVAAVALPPNGGWYATPAHSQEEATETVVLNVAGMWNEGCEEFVEEALLGDLDGISEVWADHQSDQVTIEFDPEEVTAEELAGAIENCPSYSVTGSDTHDLDLDKVKQSCSRWCHRNGDNPEA